MKDYRGKVDLIYIDPPFDSKADYKKKIKLKGQTVENDQSTFEEKQYGDIWTNDEYLQFMYERLVLMKELLSDRGSIYLHCDWHKSHYLRMILDEVFGVDNFQSFIIFYYGFNDRIFNKEYLPYDEKQLKRFSSIDKDGRRYKSITKDRVIYLDESEGVALSDVWSDVASFQTVVNSPEIQNYPTQKPEKLIERIIKASSNPGDLVFDCFMGSGTTQAVAMKLGRRFIGADINLGAVQTTTKRLINIANDLNSQILPTDTYTGFEVYNVNNYDMFRNPIEARELILQALEVQPFETSNVYDGEKDGRMIKVMPVNRIATKADLQGLIANLPYKSFEKKKEEDPNAVVLKLTLVCMGHESDLAAALKQELNAYKVDIDVVDILHDRADLQFKRDAEASVVIENGEIVIKNFYPLNLMQPTVIDIPEKNEMIAGKYKIPHDAGRIRIKITDVLSESLEIEVNNG